MLFDKSTLPVPHPRVPGVNALTAKCVHGGRDKTQKATCVAF